jgi:hypothetical protein
MSNVAAYADGLDRPAIERDERVDQAGATGRGGWPGRYVSVFARRRTYLNLVYLALSFPLGLAYFVTLVVTAAVFGSLSFTLIGIPMLIATMYGWCIVADLDRLQTNALVGTSIPPLPFRREPGRPWQWQRIKTRLANPMTWRSLVFLALRFGQGVGALVVLSVVVGLPLTAIVAPVVVAFDGSTEVLNWRIDTFAEAVPTALASIVLLPVFVRVTNLGAALSGRFTDLMLGSDPVMTPLPDPAPIDRAATAAMAWSGVTIGRTLDATAARVQTVQLKLFLGHLAFFATLSLAVVVINGLTTPNTWWALWPIWGAGILFAMHTGYFLRGFLGLHAFLFTVVNLGLFVIDSTYTNTSWFYWPVLGWGIVLGLHVYAVFGYTRIEPVGVLVAGSAEALPGAGESATDRSGEDAPAPISVDVAMRVVKVAGQAIDVTPKEFDLLVLFVQNPGRPFSREELLDRIWKNEYDVTDRTIDTHVQRLRKKLAAGADAIQTVWGVGYRFQP